MAWNEPGGGNNPRDPWGGNQGPPDLDKVLNKLRQRLGGGLFGGAGGGSGGGASATLFSGALIIALGIWAFFGLYQVDEQERAVILRFGEYQATAQPGLHWNPPLIDEVIPVNTTRVRSARFREIMLTQDENIVEVSLSVQYVIDEVKNYVLEVRKPENSLQHAAKSALRHVVGGMTMDLVLTEGRAQIASEVQGRLQNYLTDYTTGIRVSTVNVDDSRPPSQVQAAFDDVIKAREDEERVKNEAQSYANGIVPEARGKAQRQIEEASAYREEVIANAEGEAERFKKLLAEYRKAPAVTRERLYLDAVQTVFSNTSKVMVDIDGGNNMMYLPLDKLGTGAGVGGARPRPEIDSTELRELADLVSQQILRDGAAQPSRRGAR